MEHNHPIAPWFRAACVAVGLAAIYGGATALSHHLRLATHVLSVGGHDRLLGAFELLTSLASVLPLAFGICLVRYCDAIASRYADGGQSVAYGEFAAYRLAFSLAGFLIVAWSLPLMARATANHIFANGIQPRPTVTTWIFIVSAALYAAQCAVGILVIVCAPRIVKWRNPISAPAAG